MTTFIKTMLKKSDDKTNIDKYKVAANITEYHIILSYSCFVFTRYLTAQGTIPESLSSIGQF